MTRDELLKIAKPILFNTEMVRAILDGRKTETRRVVKWKDIEDELWRASECLSMWVIGYQVSLIGFYATFDDNCGNYPVRKSPYCPGDILYVRETWYKDAGRYLYRANYTDKEKFYINGREAKIKWHPSIHMPKEAARIFLRVTDVRVERLHEITAEGALHEGCGTGSEIDPSSFSIPDEWYTKNNLDCDYDRASFAALWQSTIPKKQIDEYGWNANPWVWVIEFERLEVEQFSR